ncbi:MAG TPA: sugar phosphate isomerase/epimerase family protein [Pirellulales bacterium]|nr:sugar phosphate isomerase/epimerase family protein [Pirellulales bacterium]
MLRSAVTVSLVPEARGGPFVYWDDLPAACQSARQLGYDAIEVFAPGPTAISPDALRSLLTEHGLVLAAVGTGAGWVKHGYSLTSSDRAVRRRGCDFIRAMIEFGGANSAPAIIGSMQGRTSAEVDHPSARQYLAEALEELGEFALAARVPLLFEPLNRYETNLINSIEAGVKLLQSLSTRNVKLLADLFHMNIEEVDIAAALRSGADFIGHIHFVDSNRRAAGLGHLDFGPIVAALGEIGYAGFVSAEALPYPDSEQASRQTMQAFLQVFRGQT